MKNRTKPLLVIIGFLLIGFIIRLYPLSYKNIINPDGVQYINQSKAILNGNWEQAINCGYEFISIYHLLIPIFYKILGDWVIAAKSISLLFGTLAIIPFFLISKQFFRNSTTFFIATLAFAINPFLVSHSEDLIKGPIFWFFSLLGIFFFITPFNKKDKNYFILLSSISFLIAGWARFEVIIYFIGSTIYIFFFAEDKFKKFFLFSIPLIVLFLITLLGSIFYKTDFSLWSLYLAPRIIVFSSSVLGNVIDVHIFKKSFIGLSLIFFRMLRVLYIPFLLLLIPGLWSLKKELKTNQHFCYFILLSSLSFIAVFIFYLKTEELVDRYVAYVVLPSFIFVCSGVERITQFFKAKGFKEKNIILSLSLYVIIMVIAFPQNLVHRRKDQVVYKDIGKHIAYLEKNQLVKVVAPDPRIVFFANLYSSGIECTVNNLANYNLLTNMRYHEMVSLLKKNKVSYYLWEERHWKNAKYDFLAVAKPKDFKEIMRWNTHQNTLLAFKVL